MPAVPAVFEVFVIRVHALPAVVCYSSRLLLFLLWRERSVTEYTLHTKKGEIVLFLGFTSFFYVGAGRVRSRGGQPVLSFLVLLETSLIPEASLSTRPLVPLTSVPIHPS